MMSSTVPDTSKLETDPVQFLATILKLAVSQVASDIHLRTRLHPIIRIDGQLHKMTSFPVTSPEFMKQITDKIIPAHNKEEFESRHQTDFSFGLKGIGRVRANAYYQRGSMALALRVLNTQVPEPEELGLPEVVRRFVDEERGLVLMTGATGSGKSTTLASLITEINAKYSKHILTIEDPIEYLFSDNKSIISQREVGVDTASFADAMRAALREDPDVILLGEMRDPETIDMALTAAETGHLVFSTLHSPDAAETMNRIVSVFQPNAQPTIRAKLAGNLRGIVSQRLLPHKSGKGRALAAEVMTTSKLVREYILDPLKVGEIAEVIKKGTVAEGMIPYDRSLLELVRKDKITEDMALQYASSPTDLKLKLEGF
jgi:twitching motility protein PilT